MTRDKYPIIFEPGYAFYTFYSEGPKGRIKKAVAYKMIGEGIYNLGFGDWDEINKKINDSVNSNNGDRDKVLATVAMTVIAFLNVYPKAIIVAQGSTPARTRLYQMGISSNWKEINGLFDVYGYYEDSWHLFESTRNYDAFLLSPK